MTAISTQLLSLCSNNLFMSRVESSLLWLAPGYCSVPCLFPQMLSKALMGSMIHPRSYVEVLTPSTSKYDIIWRWDLYRGSQVKVRSIGWVQIQCDWCPSKREMFGHRDRHIGGTWCESTGGRGPLTSQRERPGTHSSSRFSEEINTVDTLILNFEPPELYDNKTLLFKLPNFVVLCNNSPIKLIQQLINSPFI